MVGYRVSFEAALTSFVLMYLINLTSILWLGSKKISDCYLMICGNNEFKQHV